MSGQGLAQNTLDAAPGAPRRPSMGLSSSAPALSATPPPGHPSRARPGPGPIASHCLLHSGQTRLALSSSPSSKTPFQNHSDRSISLQFSLHLESFSPLFLQVFFLPPSSFEDSNYPNTKMVEVVLQLTNNPFIWDLFFFFSVFHFG